MLGPNVDDVGRCARNGDFRIPGTCKLGSRQFASWLDFGAERQCALRLIAARIPLAVFHVVQVHVIAHVAFGSFLKRLVVPGEIGAVA